MRKMVSTTIYLTEEQFRDLKKLNELTQVPMAWYVRKGVDLAIGRYLYDAESSLRFIGGGK